jgi:hypothetical protein
MRTRDLAAEMRAAVGALNRPQAEALVQLGVDPLDIAIFEMVGVARVRIDDKSRLDEPNDDGPLAYISPVCCAHPAAGPEAADVWRSVRFGGLCDLIAWRHPGRWFLRVGSADWLGSIPPQFLDPDAVPIWRSPLNWFRARCTGLMLLTGDPGTAHRLLMDCAGGIVPEDEVHGRELRRLLERPYPIPPILPPRHGKVRDAA